MTLLQIELRDVLILLIGFSAAMLMSDYRDMKKMLRLFEKFVDTFCETVKEKK